MYFNVYLFQNKSTRSHEVDFVLGKKNGLITKSHVAKRGGGGLIEGGALLQKNDFQRGSLSERGGLNSEVGFNRDFTVKQQPD